jgi:hypothetical protein
MEDKENTFMNESSEEKKYKVDPKHEPIAHGDLCKGCQGSAMWMPSLSNLRFCVTCYPVHIELKMGRTCDTNDELMPIDMGADIEAAPPIVTPITKEVPINRNVVLNGILGVKFRQDEKYAAFEGDDA